MPSEPSNSKIPSRSAPVPAQAGAAPKEVTETSKEVSARISEKMAAISTMRDSTTRGVQKKAKSQREKAMNFSSLPDALARIDRRLNIENSPQPSLKEESAHNDATKKQDVLDDPPPGSLRSLTWLLFRFGRYVHGPMLRQSPFTVIGVWFILSLSLCAQVIDWVGPSLTMATSLYASPEFYLRLLASFVAGALLYLLTAIGFKFLASTDELQVGLLYSLQIVVNAFLPLAAAQSLYILIHHAFLGEAFWRGAILGISPFWGFWVFPLAWAWSGLRLSQAMSSLIPFTSGRHHPAKTVTAGIVLFLGLGFHPTIEEAVRHDALIEWSARRKQLLDPQRTLNDSFFLRLEKSLPFHATQARTELYLFRLQQRFRQGEISLALEDAMRLERISPRGTAMENVAKGLGHFLRGGQDAAIRSWNTALNIDPDHLPAHRWLALASVGKDTKKAEEHAAFLMENDPNVFHLYLLVRILESQGKWAEIWEAMLHVDSPPESWYPLTLLQGSVAARELGMVRRSEQLLRVANRKEATP